MQSFRQKHSLRSRYKKWNAEEIPPELITDWLTVEDVNWILDCLDAGLFQAIDIDGDPSKDLVRVSSRSV
jgi:hypothetical protein